MINKRKMSIQRIFLAFSIVGPVFSIERSLEDGHICGPGKFPCDKFRCIPERWVCDRSPDCVDGTDELEKSCPEGVTIKSTSCKGNQYQCDNGFCLPIKWQCDGMDDCGDGSDERPELCRHNCTSNEFRCGDGQCISMAWRCDGRQDCDDNADEMNCTISSDAKAEISSTTFKCADGSSIAKRWHCDGDEDCRDGSDEKDCIDKSTTIAAEGDVEGGSLDKFRSNCREDEFKCPGSYCILASWVCDGVGDCSNSEDELNCTKNQLKCKEDEFQCKDISGCIKKTVLCDGIKHCSDNSDEANCSKVAKSKSSQIITTTTTTTSAPTTSTKRKGPNATAIPKTCNNETEFVCNDGKCIAKSKLCNGVSDCKNREDESVEECGIKECARNNGGCMQICIDTKEGHQCACANGYILVGKYSCVDINECVEVPGICSQECVNTEGSFHCSCLSGYTRDPANYTRCKASEGEAYLIFSHSYDIRSLRLRDRDMTSVVQHTRGAIALDYLYDQGKILWSDKKDKKIYRASLANTENRETLVSDQEISADGLAVDWIHRNVYYTDIARSSVRVLSWDAKYVKTLINEAVGHPRAIVVSPHKGYIYWTDWGSNAKIERASLDGSDRQAIVSYPHVVWPNGLTIDHSTERIYWCDGRLRTISKSNLDGSNIEVILYSPVFLRQPFSISVFEDRLYWTDWSQVALFSADKFTGSNIQNVSAGHLLESPKVVHVYHQYRQPKTVNICNDHQCSHFCMRSSLGNAFCSCADDYELAEDKMACIEIVKIEMALKASVVNMTDEEGRETKSNPTQEMDHEISVMHLEKLTMVENDSRVGLIIGGIVGVMLGVAVIFGMYIGWTKVRSKPIKRIKFNNPIYRKTTVDDDGRGYIIGQDQLFYNPTRSSSDYSSEAPLTDADDAPLTPKDDDDDIV